MGAKSVFVCQQCGYESAKWLGKCPNCDEWNSLVEMRLAGKKERTIREKGEIKPQKFSQIKSVKRMRTKTSIAELDRVLGGGVLPGVMVLVAGEPGIGKSTLMLQVIAKVGGLYITGEESLAQVKARAQRLGISLKKGGGKIEFLAETDIDLIAPSLKEDYPLVVVDSIQTLYSPDFSGTPGSVGQVRECTAQLLKIGKKNGIPIFLVGHITKAGAIAGPKVLEHMVDTVVYFEGERSGEARLIRATKNRFGATDEVGIFEMTEKGLIEVINPSQLFLKKRVQKVPGSVVVVTMEGSRPVLVEIQALIVPTQLAIPRRVGRGVDYNRLQLILAVLTKRLRLPLAGFDVFVNAVGGLKIEEPAADLGIALAIISSFKNLPLDEKLAVFGELGLLGELREVGQPEKRRKEAKRLGLTQVLSSADFSSINQVVKRLLK